MKRRETMKFAIIIMTGVLAMAADIHAVEKIQLKTHVCRDSAVGIQMDVPADWKARESRGSVEKYAQVTFLEPVRKGKPIRASFSVTVRKVADVGLNAEAFLAALMVRRSKLDEMKVVGGSEMPLLGTIARMTELSYKAPANLSSVKSEMISLHEQIVVFELGQRLYVAEYMNLAGDFLRYRNLFQRCLKSLKVMSGK